MVVATWAPAQAALFNVSVNKDDDDKHIVRKIKGCYYVLCILILIPIIIMNFVLLLWLLLLLLLFCNYMPKRRRKKEAVRATASRNVIQRWPSFSILLMSCPYAFGLQGGGRFKDILYKKDE